MNTTASPRTLDAWLQLLETRHPTAIDLGLERCRAVWDRMGSPRPAPACFVVAGTNGKGSVVATLCALLSAFGLRQGSYTSPHLQRYNERVQVQGEPVSDAELLEAFAAVEAARGEVSLTYFEFGTLAALWILSRARLDYAVMEIGLGGRLDAVNLLDADCAVITPIGLDHQEYLGSDLLSIGREKAGIIRPGRPVICGEANPPASVLQIAADLGAPVRRFEREFRAEAAGEAVDFAMDGVRLSLPRPALRGTYQVANMATAVAAFLTLRPDGAHDPAALGRGIRSVRVAGRFEQVHDRPTIWIDVGHNVLAAQAVAGALEEARPGQRVRCVLGMLGDKDAADVARKLAPRVSEWYCGGVAGSRGQTGEGLAGRVASAVAPAPVRAFPGISEALEGALADAAPETGILVFGSFLTAAEAARHLQLHGAAGA